MQKRMKFANSNLKLGRHERAFVKVGLTNKNEIKKRRGNYGIKVDITTESPALTGREANEMACHILALAARKRRRCGCNRPYTFLSTVSEIVNALMKESRGSHRGAVKTLWLPTAFFLNH